MTMGLVNGSRAWRQETSDYRVARVGKQYQPEMLYVIKDKGETWLPLTKDGYWADPDAYSTGEVTKRSLMTKTEAERAVWLAMKINRGER